MDTDGKDYLLMVLIPCFFLLKIVNFKTYSETQIVELMPCQKIWSQIVKKPDSFGMPWLRYP